VVNEIKQADKAGQAIYLEATETAQHHTMSHNRHLEQFGPMSLLLLLSGSTLRGINKVAWYLFWLFTA